MLDRLRLSIPFLPQHVTGASAYLTAEQAMRAGHKGELLDLLGSGIPLGARAVSLVIRTDDELSGESTGIVFKDWDIDGLHHPFESLPSSFTPLAFKVFHAANHYPFVELKASPAKLLQGHNVFGTVDIALGAAEMLSTLQQAYPLLFSMLEIQSTEVWELDCTYSARMPSELIANQVIQALRKVSNGQTKARGDEFQTTCYWGSKSSRLKRLKAYLKSAEFQAQLDKFRKDAEKGCESAKRVCAVMSDQRLQDWAKALVRFESTICKRWLERRGLSVKLVDLIAHQKDLASQGRCFIQELWRETTEDIFQAFEGQTVKATDDESVISALKAVHYSVTPKGNISYSKANKLYLFYCALREQGYAAIKQCHDGNKTFYRHIKELQEAGFSKAFLQNLQGEAKSNVIPLLRVVTVDFGSQRPDWYVEPVSQFLKVA